MESGRNPPIIPHMSKLVSITNGSGFAKTVLEVDAGGVACFAFERTDSPFPEWDYWEPDLDSAKAMCLDRWGVPPASWQELSQLD